MPGEASAARVTIQRLDRCTYLYARRRERTVDRGHHPGEKSSTRELLHV